MKKNILMLMIGLLTQQMLTAQGTLYFSNIGLVSTTNSSVGNDSWFAGDFMTGTNVNGYLLDSVQLAMSDATGSPNGFTVMIYRAVPPPAPSAFPALPAYSLGTLNGSTSPSTAGIYEYAPLSNIILSPSTYYFVVATAATPISSGGFEWAVTSTPSPGYNSYHWDGGTSFFHSNNGSSWTFISENYGQYAITATPVPEPSILSLIGLASLLFIRHCRRQR